WAIAPLLCPEQIVVGRVFLALTAGRGGAPGGAGGFRPPWCCAEQSDSSPVPPPAYIRSRVKNAHLTRSVPGKSCATLWRLAATSVRRVGAFVGIRRPLSGSLRRSYSS